MGENDEKKIEYCATDFFLAVFDLLYWARPFTTQASDSRGLKNNGFKVSSEYLDDVTNIKRQMNVSPKLASCHTAKINGYIMEGHVPACHQISP